jgi:hypothetical protein
MFKLIDPDHAFYRPLWIRLLVVAVCASWTAVEFTMGSETWGFILLAITAYTSATLLVFYKPKDPVLPAPTDGPGVNAGPVAEGETGREERP